MTNEIMVSICCITYNHEDYIADAIEGFIKQKTNFKYEIIIHDDASTDRTAEIIREYENRFPDIIKPIYQIENQYSKGVSVSALVRKKQRGKYIALCEGDDYWTDEYKLQKQVSYMEENPECTFCFSNAHVEDQNNKGRNRLVIPWLTENKNYFNNRSRRYSAGELQLLGFIPPMSFLYPKRVLDNLPNWYFDAPVGDNAVKLIATSYGYAYYMNESMCIYRFNVPGSVTTNWKKENTEQIVQRCNGFITMLENFNEYTNKKYDSEIELSKLTWEIQRLRLMGDYKRLKDKKFNSYLNLLSGPEKIKSYISFKFPSAVEYRKKIKSIFQ
ncbi:glycosyl transferase family 2 [Lysinibacillus sp. 2017]|uniref:glycosyltransferase family 2 protein n=1 Tax=unclassified Lysinibacillus TaxID=2636778 RepID=UPI000D52A212|nr:MULTISPECIES: glycosyltransferase [unclassified Lysinibacillus]AWE06763.1 glycosyl transferase family 2 [Lysinibacillus sp. 2017]TGN37305.1 glycosyltransferase [Lysinibacillus sp. S2017]